MSVLDIRMLGELQVQYAGREVCFDTSPRLQTFFAYLVLYRGVALSRAQLAYLFWPDSSNEQARANLRRLILYLRRLLPEAERFVRLEGQTLLWYKEAPFSLDINDFERALARSKNLENLAERRAALEEAERLYKGDLLPGRYEDCLEPERQRLRGLFAQVLSQLVALHEHEGDHRFALHYAERLIAYDPLVEESHRRLMTLYSHCGQRAKALHAYHRCVSLLQEELATQPDRETQALYERLLGQASAPFVGREGELATLREAWGQAVTGRASMVLIGGESGIGKTRLAEVFLESLEGVKIATTRCYGAEGNLAYAPVTDLLRTEATKSSLLALDDLWLTEVARLLPELRQKRPELTVPGPLNEGWQRQRFFEALARAVLVRQPLLLMIDDLQWCDRDSLEWLHYLLRFDPEARVLIIGTFRLDEVLPSHPLVSLCAALEREEKLVKLELGALDEETTGAMAQALSEAPLEPKALTQLYRETEGYPLFVVEMMREGGFGQNEGEQVSALPLPPRLRTVIAARLAKLSSQAKALAETAALIGRTFTFELLAEASRQDEDILIRGLDELWQKRILRERDARGYDFSHDKLREVAATELGPARRRQLHHAIAEALETLHAHDKPSVSGQIAFHYEQAGQWERAVPYYQRAAEEAQRLYANDEALALYGRALTLLEALSGRQQLETAARIYERMADIYKLQKQHDEARAYYSRALEHLPTPDPIMKIMKARLKRKAGTSWIAQYRYDKALEMYEQAEKLLGPEPAGENAPWWQEWIDLQIGRLRTLYWLNRWRDMQALTEKIEPALQRHGNASQRSRFFQSLGLMVARRDRYVVSEELLTYARAALEAAQETGSLSEIAVARFGLGFCYFSKGELVEAAAHIRAVLELAERTGDRTLFVRSLTYLSVTQRRMGDAEKTRELSLELQAQAESAQMFDYLGVARANFAWLAWLKQDAAKTKKEARAALELWKTGHEYMFKWTALFPLLAAELFQQKLPEALICAGALLAPEQQALPLPLSEALEAAVGAGKNLEAAKAHLARALKLAKASRFL